MHISIPKTAPAASTAPSDRTPGGPITPRTTRGRGADAIMKRSGPARAAPAGRRAQRECATPRRANRLKCRRWFAPPPACAFSAHLPAPAGVADGAGLPVPGAAFPAPAAGDDADDGAALPVGAGPAETAVPEGKTVGPVNSAAMDASVPTRFDKGPPGKV